MTIDDIKARPEYVSLGSEQMKKWVIEGLTNGLDWFKATETVYNATTERSVQATVNRNLADPRIKSLLKAYIGQGDVTGSKTETLAIVWKQIQSTTDPAILLDYLKLYGEWMGFKSSKPVEPPSTADPNDEWALVKEMEAKQ